MRRREVIGALAVTAWQASYGRRSPRPEAAAPRRPHAAVPRDAPHWIAFEKRLREQGFVDGEQCRIEFVDLRAGSQDPAAAMRSLVQAGIDIVAASSPEEALKGAAAATRDLPIVMTAVDYDPLARGDVASLVRRHRGSSGPSARLVRTCGP